MTPRVQMPKGLTQTRFFPTARWLPVIPGRMTASGVPRPRDRKGAASAERIVPRSLASASRICSGSEGTEPSLSRAGSRNPSSIACAVRSFAKKRE